MVVQHNLSAMNANRYLGINNSKLSKSLEKLSSGYAINRAGDNAAGLAVSEKMRSQIAGMTQAVKNAQDGISMVQTFEGALTETDSILQRMKTLANQMANGSYDDPVDRTAAQQEFLQLNDELDQIADTDFNGVVVLNGGKMADGLEAVNGEFNYKAAKEAAAAKGEPVDVTKYTKTAQTTDEAAGAILDNSDYDADAATALWDALGLDASKVKDLNITFQKDGDSWKAVAATGGTAAIPAVEGKPATNGSAAAVENIANDDGSGGGETNTIGDAAKAITWLEGKGAKEGTISINRTGTTYTVTDGEGNNIAGVTATILADMGITGNIGNGDTITFDYTAKVAPTDEVKAQDAVPASEKDLTKEYIEKINKELKIEATDNGGFKVSWDGGNHDVNAVFGAYKAKDGDYITLNFKNTDKKTYAPTNIGVNENTLSVKADGTTETKVVPEGAIKVELGDAIKGKNDAMTADIKKALDALKTAKFTVAANGDITTDATDIAVSTGGELSVGTGAAKVVLGQITVDTDKIDGWDTTNGEAVFQLNVDDYNLADTKDITANSVETSALSKKAMEPFAVSKSDAFKNSETIMTYKESIILQAGARTKDAVEFTFKYNSDAIGDLEADLNCTAKGLGTSKLNLSTQKAANDAIDKIDQAINKVSLVRGTFGAIQNRLEHKIDNLNVSVENLTSAESQIRDTNMPQEMMNFTKQQILAQASQSMLAQANQLPQGVLSLLQ